MFNRYDSESSKTKALPAAAATAYTASINLKSIGDVPLVQEFMIDAPAVPSLVDAKTIIYKVQESADDSSWADAAWTPSVTQTGASSAGAAAATLRFQAPSNAKKYIRVSATVLTGGGDNTAKSFGLKVYV